MGSNPREGWTVLEAVGTTRVGCGERRPLWLRPDCEAATQPRSQCC